MASSGPDVGGRKAELLNSVCHLSSPGPCVQATLIDRQGSVLTSSGCGVMAYVLHFPEANFSSLKTGGMMLSSSSSYPQAGEQYFRYLIISCRFVIITVLLTQRGAGVSPSKICWKYMYMNNVNSQNENSCFLL